MPELSSSSSETNATQYRLIRPRPQVAKLPRLLPKERKPRLLKPWPPLVPIHGRQYSAFRPFNANISPSQPRPIRPAPPAGKTMIKPMPKGPPAAGNDIRPIAKPITTTTASSDTNTNDTTTNNNNTNTRNTSTESTSSTPSPAQASDQSTLPQASTKPPQYPPIRPASSTTPAPITVSNLAPGQTSLNSAAPSSQTPASFTGPFYLVPTPGSNGVYQLIPAPFSGPPVPIPKLGTTPSKALIVPKRRTRRCQLCNRFGCRGSQRRHLCTAKATTRQ
ncbi:hypothetical protein Unana1_05194 [Umbelopsis nana]